MLASEQSAESGPFSAGGIVRPLRPPGYGPDSVCLCAASRKTLCMDLHEFFLQKLNLGRISRWFHFGGDKDLPSLSFRGHMLFRHKIDCSAETVINTTKVTPTVEY